MNNANPVRIHITFPESPLGKVVKQVVSSPIRVFVETREDADLILLTEANQIESFDSTKAYAFLNSDPDIASPDMPKNVRIITEITLLEILEVIEEVAKTLDPHRRQA